jgi:hypothetical protein
VEGALMGVILANDILQDVGYALIEIVVNTTLNPGGATVTPGIQTVTPANMAGIYAGAQIVVGSNGAAAQEVVTVTSVTAFTFTATFVNSHPNLEPISGCTFSSGVPTYPMFTQSEVLGYMADSQNDFLLQVRPVYAIAPLAITVGRKVYPAPADAIRIERASIVNTVATPKSAVELWNTTQTDLDLENAGWPGDQGPSSWYQDQLTYQTIGFGPPPNVGNTVTLMYSQKAVAPLGLLSTFLVPDPMTIAIKWRTLALCLSKDGEMRDPARAAFAQAMYDLLVKISQKFMSGIDARMTAAEETVEPLAAQRF